MFTEKVQSENYFLLLRVVSLMNKATVREENGMSDVGKSIEVKITIRIPSEVSRKPDHGLLNIVPPGHGTGFP